MKLGPIVEGFGDVKAVPILLRRMLGIVAPNRSLEVLQPYRVPRQKLVKEGELERVVDFVGRQTGPGGAIIVVVDADDDCPALLGPELLRRARTTRPDRKTSVVLAKHEFETWFIGAAASLAGHRSLPEGLIPPPNPEHIRGAKEWLSKRMGQRGYSETLDQPALAAVMDVNAARACDSFDKLARELALLFAIAP